MQGLNTYKALGLNDAADVFDYLINSLRYSNRTFDFYVD